MTYTIQAKINDKTTNSTILYHNITEATTELAKLEELARLNGFEITYGLIAADNNINQP